MTEMQDARDELKRKQAREDYVALGHKRSVEGLWKEYCRKRKQGDPLVPTTNRNTIYRWAKEDQWEAYAKEQIEGLIDNARKVLEDQRIRAYRDIALATDKATVALLEIVQIGTNAERLKAAAEILDRAGIVKQDGRKADIAELRSERASDAPAADAPEADLLQYLADKAKERTNG